MQLMNYEDEKRPDVLYGYPNTLISYPIPGTAVPPWLAEGIAQYMYENADWDHWDTHRDMIMRDRVIHDNLLTFTEMNTFGFMNDREVIDLWGYSNPAIANSKIFSPGNFFSDNFKVLW